MEQKELTESKITGRVVSARVLGGEYAFVTVVVTVEEIHTSLNRKLKIGRLLLPLLNLGGVSTFVYKKSNDFVVEVRSGYDA